MVEGVIGKISAKSWQNKTFYSFALNGQEGWYNLGIKRPPKEGTSVRFEFTVNDKGYKNVEGPIEIRADGEVGPATLPVKTSGGSTNSNSGAYWDRKESRDIRNDDLRELGATRNTAIAFIDLAIKHEAIKLPATAKREGFLWDVLDRYVNKLRGKNGSTTTTDTAASSGAKEAGGGGVEETAATSSDPEADGWG